MEALFERPLFVGAHVDDIELFAGGTVARFAKNAKAIVFSRHAGVYESPQGEFEDSMVTLGVEDYYCHDLMACQPKEHSFHWCRDELFKILDESSPTIVVTHQSTDTNQDHRQVHEEVLRVFRGKCPIVCGSFLANDLPSADRRLFVKVSKEQAIKKVDALASYKSQIRPHRNYLDYEAVTTPMKYWGQYIGCEFAEAYEVIRLWL